MQKETTEPLTAKAIFLKAMELADERRRQQWLQLQCGDYPELLCKVEALLVAAGRKSGASPLDAVADAMGVEETVLTADLEPSPDATTKPLPPKLERQQIGPYKLLEQIGQGGFGTVYMAEQTVPVKRKVALKVLKPGMDSSEVIARFEAERQALAMMDHPNIARVLDGGTTEQGQPYFVMELVRGVPVTDYCDEVRATTEERLALFVDICRAVQHAHQKGIIHRDLKPGNVLVTMHDDKPVPKVIDFGIAKALSQQLTDRTLFTGYQQMLGTPAYMSPEQAQMSGIDIDTRSDVYSLGVLLYELLTGTTPFDKSSLAKISIDDLRKMIREQDPPRPSVRITTMEAKLRSTMADRRRIDQRRVSEELRGELDWIVMKALEKDRNRRYESASALAADVQRFLSKEQVQACPPTIGYRLGKLYLRNKIAVAFGTLVLVGMLTAIVGLVIANGILASSQQQTRDALAEASTNFLVAETRAEEAKAAQVSEQESRKLAEESYSQSITIIQQMLDKISEWNLNEQPGLEQYRVQLLEAAESALAKLLTSRPTDQQALHIRSEVLHTLAKDYTSMHRTKDALDAYRNAVLIADKVVESSAVSKLEYRAMTWNIRYGYSFLLAQNGQMNEAIKVLEIASEKLEPEVRANPEDKLRTGQLCNILRTLGELEAMSGQDQAASKHLQQACVLLGFQVNDELQLTTPLGPESVETLCADGILYDPVARLLMTLASQQRDPAAQLDLYEKSVGVTKALVNRYPTRERRHQLASDLRTYAAKLHHDGNQQKAMVAEQESITLLEMLTKEFPAFTAYRSDLTQLRGVHAETLGKLNRVDEALAILNKRIAENPNESDGYFSRGRLYQQQRSYQEALADYETAIQLRPDDWSYHAQVAMLLYWSHTNDGTLPDARRGLEHAHITAKLQPENPRSWSLIAQGYHEVGDTEEEAKHFRKAIEIDPLHSYGLSWLVEEQLRRGETDQAAATVEKLLGRSPEDADHWRRQAQVYAARKQFEKALEAYAQAIRLSPEATYIYKERGDLRVSLGDQEKALDDFSIAIDIEPNAVHLYKRRANCNLELGRFDHALTDVKNAILLKPDDIDTLNWIRVPSVVTSPDSKFKEELIRLADGVVRQNGESPASLLMRGRVFAKLGEYKRARQDLERSNSDKPPYYFQQYEIALLSLILEDLATYSKTCKSIPDVISEGSTPIANHFAAWICALSPDAIDDYKLAIEFSRKAVAAEPENAQFKGGLGAILFRAGDLNEAHKVLTEALDLPPRDGTSLAYIHYFLAMTEHHLGHIDEAKGHLQNANEIADAELSKSPPWNRKLTLELLLKEAAASLNTDTEKE